MRLFVITRHGESTLNLERRVNGDPAREVPLTERGEEESRLLGLQVSQLPLDACVHTRFPRSRQTAEIAVAEREDVPLVVEPLLDDVDIGDFDGAPLEEYRAWKHSHARNDLFRAARASTTPDAATRPPIASCSRAPTAACSSSATRFRFATP